MVAADVNGDGWPSFVMTAFDSEYHSLFINTGAFPFDDATLSSRLGRFTMQDVGWGTHFIDYDNDGDTDVIFACLQGRPVLLRNNVGQDNAWIGSQLVGTTSNRDAIGSKLTVRQGNRKLVFWITGGASIFSSHDHRVIFGLGSKPGPRSVTVEIRWPNGETQSVADLQPNQYHKIVEPK